MDKNRKKDTALVLFVYNRYEHLGVTLKKLESFDLSWFSIYVFCDGSKDYDDSVAVKKVRQIVYRFKAGRENVNVVESVKNKGLAKSVFDGLNKCFENVERAIVLEDDILVREGFFEFMVNGLKNYSEQNQVAGIAGYSYIKQPLDKNYFLPVGTSWGWGTWKRVWQKVRDNPQYYYDQIAERGLVKEFNFGRYPFYNILSSTVEGKNSSWAIQFYAQFFLDQQVFLFPSTSLCENIGFDNAGTHTGVEMKSFNSKDDSAQLSKYFPESVKTKKRYLKLARKSLGHYGPDLLKKRLLNKITRMLKYGR